MTLQEQLREKREAAAKALEAAKAIRAEVHGGDSSAEKLAALTTATKDYTDAHSAAEKLQAAWDNVSALERAEEIYNQPVREDRFPLKSEHGVKGGAEAFAAYAKWALDAEKRGLTEPKGPSADGVNRLREAHNAAFMSYLRTGSLEEARSHLTHSGFGPKETHALLGTQSDVGGFLVPPDFRAEVLRAEAGIAVFRQAGARVVPTSSSRLVFPTITGDNNVYSSGVSGAWKPEGYVTGGTVPPTQSKPNTGQEQIPVHGWQPNVIEVTQELMMDSAAPLDSILAELLGETKALDEDGAFIGGDGVGKPEGILNAGLSSVVSGGASSLTYTGLLNVLMGLPVQYRQRSSWIFNSATLASILALQTSAGFLIFPPNGLGNMPDGTPKGAVGMMLGRPAFCSEFMPDIAASAYPIAIGDFSRYIIAERTDLRIQRLTERYAPNIGILATARLGGQLTRTNAFRLQKVSA